MQEVKKNQETNKEAGQLPKSVIEIPGDKKLHKNCKSFCSLLLPETMNHNEFDFFDDLTIPFSTFLLQCGISFEFSIENGFLNFPSDLFTPPNEI